MWKGRRPAGHKGDTVTNSERVIERRDKTIRILIDELVSGTQELRSLYTGEDKGEKPHPA